MSGIFQLNRVIGNIERARFRTAKNAGVMTCGVDNVSRKEKPGHLAPAFLSKTGR
jgi:hypothetical protein